MMDAPKPTFEFPSWFPRNPLLDEAAATRELNRQWNFYLSIPKDSPARRAFTKDLTARYGLALEQHYASLAPLDQALPPHTTSHTTAEQPSPLKRALVDLTAPQGSAGDTPEHTPYTPYTASSATTYYTATQVELSKLIAMQMELLARSKGASILDMRKAYDHWLRGHEKYDKDDFDKLQRYGHF